MAMLGSPAGAVVVISDGFGDGDLNNDGVPFEIEDTNVNGSLEDTTWVPGRLSDGSGTEPENTEVTGPDPEDASDTGIRWLAIRGFTSASGDFAGAGSPKPGLTIVNDSLGAQLETKPNTETGGLGRAALDSGNALSWESRGGGSEGAGFFDRRIFLGAEVDDEVKVSFDFRLWGDTPNAEELMPDNSELRFGLFQDTDDQLGMTNPYAGRQVDENGDPLSDPTNTATPGDLTDSFRPAVWGQDDGIFEGRLSDAGIGDPAADIGTRGDAGWTVGLLVGDNITNPTEVDGGGARIREEVQADRILQGSDVEFVASPENVNEDPFGTPMYDFVNMETEKAYTIELSLKRATSTVEADAILATLTVIDKTTLEEFSFSGLEEDFQSDSWDYFALRNADSGANEIDFLIDNFAIEVLGSNAIPDGDYNEDGIVDAADYTVWRDGDSPDSSINGYLVWRDNFGAVGGFDPNAGGGSVLGVPEPGAALVCLAGLAMGLAATRRHHL